MWFRIVHVAVAGWFDIWLSSGVMTGAILTISHLVTLFLLTGAWPDVCISFPTSGISSEPLRTNLPAKASQIASLSHRTYPDLAPLLGDDSDGNMPLSAIGSTTVGLESTIGAK